MVTFEYKFDVILVADRDQNHNVCVDAVLP
jgi:hypothetical protein